MPDPGKVIYIHMCSKHVSKLKNVTASVTQFKAGMLTKETETLLEHRNLWVYGKLLYPLCPLPSSAFITMGTPLITRLVYPGTKNYTYFAKTIAVVSI